MAFGFTMRFPTDNGLQVILKPYTLEDAATISRHTDSPDFCRYLGLNGPQTVVQEEEWVKKVSDDPNSTLWAIWVEDGGEEVLIGSTSYGLKDPKNRPLMALSGSGIYDTRYWGQRIMSACHRVRTWYAFEQDGLLAIESDVLEGNIGSLKALQSVGYVVIGCQYRYAVVEGRSVKADSLVVVNPLSSSWEYFWGGETPPQEFAAARSKTQAAFDWARDNVRFG